MTKDKKKVPRMSASDKRRSALAGLRSSSPATSASTSASAPAPASGPAQTLTAAVSSPPQTSTPSAAAPENSSRKDGTNIIAPPPRAQLGNSNANTSPSPEDDAGAGAGTPKDNASSSKERDTIINHTSLSKDTSPKSKKSGGGANGRGGTTIDPSPPSAAATGVLLKEKHQRIAQLERELGTMESEFSRQLDSLSRKECETATFWQGRHETAQAQLARAEGELELQRAEIEVRDAERLELTSGWEAVGGQLAEREREANDLRAQVRGLKEFVSTSTRTDGVSATSDEVFCNGMARLGNGLQNWVISNFRKVKMDLNKIGDDVRAELEALVPMYEELSKVHIIQSLVSRMLVDMIFGTYYVGLSRGQAKQFRDTEATLLSLLGSQETVNQWRASTLTLIRREGQQKCQAETDAASKAVVSRVNRLLGAVTDAQATDLRDQALRAQIGSAIDLARLLAVQKAVFTVSMPHIVLHQRTMFDPATMEDIGGEDEDSLEQREISCVTFPGIIKRGDENGGQLQYQNVIVKARVFCSPE